MGNKFDPANSPTTEPEEIFAGDFIQWRRVDLSADYPNDEYTLTYHARLSGAGSTKITISSAVYESDFLFSIAGATSAAFIPGFYYWQLDVVRTSDGETLHLESGTFEVRPDYELSATDPRSHARIVVDKIRSILEGRADSDVDEYSIAGRSISKMSIDDLLKWKTYYEHELEVEDDADRLARGKPTRNTIQMRFVGS